MRYKIGQRVVVFYFNRLLMGVVEDKMLNPASLLEFQFLIKLDEGQVCFRYLNCSMVYPISDNVSTNKIKALEVLLRNENT
jgi:hypothetical protein